MGEGLAMIQKKLDRADEHLKTLHDELRSMMHTEGNRIFAPVEFDRNTGWYLSKIGDFSNLNTRISILAGEICYQLLSVLEHAVWQMIKAANKIPDRKCNRFPFMLEPPEAPHTFLSLARNSALKNVPVAAVEVIENIQPYKTRDNYLLSVKTLADIDKHRFLLTWIISMSNPEEIQGLYILDPPGPLQEVRVSIQRGQRLETGTELARVRLSSDDGERKVYMKGRFATRIDICEVPGGPPAPSLDVMSAQVGTIVNDLEPFLG